MPRKSYDELSFLYAKNLRNGRERRRYLNLVKEDQEVLCELAFDDPALQIMQLKIVKNLLEKYEKKPKTRFNKQKIANFEKLKLNLQKSEEQRKKEEAAEKAKSNWIIETRNWIRNVNIKQSLRKLKIWYQNLSPYEIPYQAINTYGKTKKWAKNFSFSAFNFKYHGWFTSIRLFFLRVNRFPIMLKVVDPRTGRFSVFASIIRIGGLSYIFNILSDLAIIIDETFIQSLYDNDDKTYGQRAWSRFKAVIWEDRRIYRMANDMFWLAINAYGVFAGGPWFLLVNAMINVIGFGFDFCNEALLGFFKNAKYSFLGDYLSNVVARQKFEIKMQRACDIFLMANPQDGQYAVSGKFRLNLYKNEDARVFYYLKGKGGNRQVFLDEERKLLVQGREFNSEKLTHAKVIETILGMTVDRKPIFKIRAPGARLSEEEAEKLEQENKLLSLVRDKIEEKRIKDRNDTIRVCLSAAFLVVGMFLIFFPPATLPASTLIGAGVALFCGSITMSLGTRVLDLAREFKQDVMDWWNDVSDGPSPPGKIEEPQMEMATTKDIKGVLEKPENTRLRHASSLPVIKEPGKAPNKKSGERLSLMSSLPMTPTPLSSTTEIQDKGVRKFG